MNLPYDLSKTARVASIFLLIYCLAEVIFTWHSFQLFGFYDDIESGLLSSAEIDEEATRVDMLAVPVAGFFMIALFGCFIVCGMWIYRAASNAAAIVPDDDRITPGWAVGWYFIPFANLWMPFRAMTQTRNGLNGLGPSEMGATGLMWAWWLLWLVGNYVAWFGFRLNMDANTIEDFRLATTFDVVSSAAAIPGAFLFRKLILDMTVASAEARPVSPDLEEGQL